MVKNNISFQLIIICIISTLLYSCQHMTGTFYQYYIGTLKIRNPVLLEFENYDKMYVCSDSILYCCNDSDWINRKDVFPYIITIENNEQTPVCFNGHWLNGLKWFNRGYYPFYKCMTNVNNITVYKFYYNLETFDLYMQAKNGYWYDISDPEFKNAYADCFDYFSYGKDYEIVVKHHYSFFQTLKLHKKYKIP